MNEQEAARLFKALGDENRIRIVAMIAQTHDICACTLLEELAITQPTLSHHMKVLCESGLVTCRKEGKWMHYAINRSTLAHVLAAIAAWK